MTKEISNSQDVIDSRDIIERIEELEGMGIIPLDEIPQDDDVEDIELAEELQHLKALTEEAEGYAEDWKCGVGLIRDSYFEEYAEELCKNIGALPNDVPWYIVIDWEATAGHIRQDYTSVEFDGVTYWVR